MSNKLLAVRRSTTLSKKYGYQGRSIYTTYFKNFGPVLRNCTVPLPMYMGHGNNKNNELSFALNSSKLLSGFPSLEAATQSREHQTKDSQRKSSSNNLELSGATKPRRLKDLLINPEKFSEKNPDLTNSRYALSVINHPAAQMSFLNWINDSVELSMGTRVKASHLHQNYSTWVRQQSVEPLSKRAFIRLLRDSLRKLLELGEIKEESYSSVTFIGLRLIGT